MIDHNGYYSLTDAAAVLGCKPEMLPRALARLPDLKQRNGLWQIEDLAVIDDVIKTQIVPELAGREAS